MVLSYSMLSGARSQQGCFAAAFLPFFFAVAVLTCVPGADALRPSYEDELRDHHGHLHRARLAANLEEDSEVDLGDPGEIVIPQVGTKKTLKQLRHEQLEFIHGHDFDPNVHDPLPYPRRQRFAYVRHGESTGNAWKRFDYADGRLTDSGEKDAKKAAIALYKQLYVEYQENPDDIDGEITLKLDETSLAYFILNEVTVVYVSPLRRAMATAIIFMLTLWREHVESLKGSDWVDGMPLPAVPPMPEFRVKQTIQEKVKSDSEVVGERIKKLEDEDTEDYINRMARKWSKKLFSDAHEHMMDSKMVEMFASWQTEGRATLGDDIKDTTDGPKRQRMFMTKMPTSMEKFFANIHEFKVTMAEDNEPSLIVAHSGVSRFMFYGLNGLPDPDAPWNQWGFDVNPITQIDSYFDRVSRPVVKLANGGVVDGTWHVEPLPAKPVRGPHDTEDPFWDMQIYVDGGLNEAIETRLPYFSFTVEQRDMTDRRYIHGKITQRESVPLMLGQSPTDKDGKKNAKPDDQWAMFDDPKWVIREVAGILPPGAFWQRWRVSKHKSKGAKKINGAKVRMMTLASRDPNEGDAGYGGIARYGTISFLEGTDVNQEKWGDPIDGGKKGGPISLRYLRIVDKNSLAKPLPLAPSGDSPLILQYFDTIDAPFADEDKRPESSIEWELTPYLNAGYGDILVATQVKEEIIAAFNALQAQCKYIAL